MKWLCSALLLSLFALLAGCTASEFASPSEYPAAHRYLKSKGYDVLSYKGRITSYTLTRKQLASFPNSIYWGLQSVNPDDYMGTTIDIEQYIVRNHPLSKGEVDIYVYESNGRPIGGTSFPHGDRSVGRYWSLEGRTLEQVQPLPLQQWRAAWQAKYGDASVRIID